MFGSNIRRSALLTGWAILVCSSMGPAQAQSPNSPDLPAATPTPANQPTFRADGSGFNAVCGLADSQGNTLDLSRMCGSSQTSGKDRFRPRAIPPTRPNPLSTPSQIPGTQVPDYQVPDYGVIFLRPVGSDPIHLGYRANYLTSDLGNASSGPIRNLRIYYDILVSIDGEYASIGKGSKLIRAATLAPGKRTAMMLSRIDVMDHVMPAFRPNRDISIQVTALGWTEADGSRNSFAPDSYKLAQGIGRCHFPWERDFQGRRCGSRAVSNRLPSNGRG